MAFPGTAAVSLWLEHEEPGWVRRGEAAETVRAREGSRGFTQGATRQGRSHWEDGCAVQSETGARPCAMSSQAEVGWRGGSNVGTEQ